MDGAAIIVPRRRDHGWRDDLWSHVHAHLAADRWRVCEGHHTEDEGPFSRAIAVNRAADAAWETGADVVVVMDSDTIVSHHQIRSAVQIARATGTVAFGFYRYAALDEAGTRLILGGYDGDWEPFVAYEFVLTASSCLAVRRDLWDRVGGFDQRFVGWGWEDVAFSLACQTLGDGMHRVGGTAWHLWHESAVAAGDDRHPLWRANRDLCRPYQAAEGNPEAMAAVIAAR